MKNKHTSLKLIVVILSALFLSGCLNDLFEEKDLTLQGNPQLEFRPLNQSVADTAGAEIQPADESLRVQLIGPQRDSDLSVGFSVDSENSSAQEGTHYNIVTSSPLALPANSSSTGNIEIEIIEGSVPEGEVVELVLILEDAEGVEAAENLKSYTLTIEGGD
jgi:hypothetical protein